AALPVNFKVGRWPGRRTTSTSCQVTPCRRPVPMAFIPASLAAKRAARRSSALGLPRQYRTSSGVKRRRKKRSPKRSREALILGTSVISTPVPTIICVALPRYHILRFLILRLFLFKERQLRNSEGIMSLRCFVKRCTAAPATSNLPALPSQKGANFRNKECV